MAKRKLMDAWKVRKVVEGRVDVRTRMGHEGAPFNGGSIDDSQLLIPDSVGRLARKLGCMTIVRLGQVINHKGSNSPRIARHRIEDQGYIQPSACAGRKPSKSM